MYFREICIHLCDMIVHVCIHVYGRIHLLSDSCAWQDSFIRVTLNHSLVSDGPVSHFKVLQCYIADAYSFLFLYYVEPIPMYVCIFHCPPYVYTFIQRERTHLELCVYMHTHVYLERDKFATWQIHLYVFSWRMHSYVWHDGSYVLSCWGHDASVSSFLRVIWLYIC